MLCGETGFFRAFPSAQLPTQSLICLFCRQSSASFLKGLLKQWQPGGCEKNPGLGNVRLSSSSCATGTFVSSTHSPVLSVKWGPGLEVMPKVLLAKALQGLEGTEREWSLTLLQLPFWPWALVLWESQPTPLPSLSPIWTRRLWGVGGVAEGSGALAGRLIYLGIHPKMGKPQLKATSLVLNWCFSLWGVGIKYRVGVGGGTRDGFQGKKLKPCV